MPWLIWNDNKLLNQKNYVDNQLLTALEMLESLTVDPGEDVKVGDTWIFFIVLTGSQ